MKESNRVTQHIKRFHGYHSLFSPSVSNSGVLFVHGEGRRKDNMNLQSGNPELPKYHKSQSWLAFGWDTTD